MICKHPKRSRWAVNYSDGGLLVWRIDCLRCGGVVPLGPANDTMTVRLEILAAEVALEFKRPECYGELAVALCKAPSSMDVDPYIGSFTWGWSDSDRSDVCADSYAAGALARHLWEGR